MECPYCEKELDWHDWYGTKMWSSSPKKSGDIYRCQNEECEVFDEYFYTDGNGEVHEGYPC